MKLYTSPKDHINNSYICRIRNAFAHGLNTRHKLPRILVIFLDEGLFNFADTSECLIGWLSKEIHRCIQTKLDQLPKSCLPKLNTKVLLVKPTPISFQSHSNDYHTKLHWDVSNAIDAALKEDRKNFSAFNINLIHPRNDLLFENYGNKLLAKGYETAWIYVDDFIRDIIKTETIEQHNQSSKNFQPFKNGGKKGKFFKQNINKKYFG